MTVNLRPATSVDAVDGSRVLRRAIVELCHADHGGDPALIAAWTANKTPENWLAWLMQPGASLFVAERSAALVGVGMVDAGGMILLNYVAPEARYRGVSTALLKAMEQASIERGATACRLETTKTARPFYRSRGYAPVVADTPMILAKNLA